MNFIIPNKDTYGYDKHYEYLNRIINIKIYKFCDNIYKAHIVIENSM